MQQAFSSKLNLKRYLYTYNSTLFPQTKDDATLIVGTMHGDWPISVHGGSAVNHTFVRTMALYGF